MDYNGVLNANNINTVRIASIDRLLRNPRILLSVKDLNSNGSGAVFDLLMDSIIRRGDGLIFNRVREEYQRKISKFISVNEPIQFVFQGFPFKCHNPVETLRRARTWVKLLIWKG